MPLRRFLPLENQRRYDLVEGYNNHYHSSIKMTPIEFIIIYSLKIKSKFKIGDTVRITKYKI
uniref:Transposase n=1 Tax=Heterorhabditis bacteriophora TaxID=37862 RepID=A0A1I7WQL2_HETBA